jgi:hypothetical protein
MAKKSLTFFVLIVLLPAVIWLVHEPLRPGTISYPPFDLTAINTPGDSLGSIALNWLRISGDNDNAPQAATYSILRAQKPDGPFDQIGTIPFSQPGPASKSRQFRDITASLGSINYYKVAANPDGKVIESNIAGPVQSIAQLPSDTTANLAQVIFPPTQLRVFDTPNDNGNNITLEWKLSPNDIPKSKEFRGYDIYRGTSPDGPFVVVGDVTGGESDEGRHVKIFGDANKIDADSSYYYYVAAKWDSQMAKSNIAGPVKAKAQWFHKGRSVSLLLLGILIAAILFYIQQAKAGKELYIRKIAGLEAVDEAVGRATEMGKKVFYVPGTQDMDNVQTIAGLTLLERVARLTAEYETKLEVPVSRSLVMITAREVVREAYINAGRPDSYNDSMIYYLTDDQFGYAAAIDGLVVRQKPATMFYMGAFYAESLILAETGNSIGAIQIAGTAMPAQLPFFVAACDYTLIGEELFAASAYLSREPKLLGSLKGQDIGGKLVFISLAAVFIIIVSMAAFAKPTVVAYVTRIFMVH